jgi:hypothetical protein
MKKDELIAALQQIKEIVAQALAQSGQQPKTRKKASREKPHPAPKTAKLDTYLKNCISE